MSICANHTKPELHGARRDPNVIGWDWGAVSAQKDNDLGVSERSLGIDINLSDPRRLQELFEFPLVLLEMFAQAETDEQFT